MKYHTKKLVCKNCGNDFSSRNLSPMFCSVACRAAGRCKNLDIQTIKTMYESGLSQREIAEKLSVAQTLISRYLINNNIKTRSGGNHNQSGEKNFSWKGDSASYSAYHRRIAILYGKPKKCEVCGTTSNYKRYDWANLTGKYNDPADYKRMCRSCHWKYDKKHLNFGSYKHFSKMSDAQRESCKIEWKGRGDTKILAKKYGVNISTIQKIIYR